MKSNFILKNGVSGESSLVRTRTLFKGETLKDYIGDEELYIELTSTKSSV